MTEERKHAILFAATLLSARKLLDLDPDKPSMQSSFSWIVRLMMPLSFSNG